MNTPTTVANANAALETALPHGSARATTNSMPLTNVTRSRTARNSDGGKLASGAVVGEPQRSHYQQRRDGELERSL